jgi:23S rRNA (guanosine2251-2'-O)-methyltransferase
VPVTTLTAEQVSRLTGTERHQGIAARVGPFPYATLDEILAPRPEGDRVVVVLDGVQDPANLGGILRTAECLGACGLVLAKDRAAPITPVVEKASAGATAHLPVVRVTNLSRALGLLKEPGYWTFAAVPHSGRSCYDVDLSGDVALVLGSEHTGVRRLVRDTCDGLLTVPTRGRIDSLNVAHTAAILLAEVFRRSLEKDRPTGGTAEDDS